MAVTGDKPMTVTTPFRSRFGRTISRPPQNRAAICPAATSSSGRREKGPSSRQRAQDSVRASRSGSTARFATWAAATFRPAIGRISIFTTSSAAGLVILALILSPCFSANAQAGRKSRQTDAAQISRLVGSLGADHDNLKIVAQLANAPELAISPLIQQLHPIYGDRILASQKRPDAEHVLWCIRALRYLCGGQDFCAQTKHVFGNSELERNRKYWLYDRHHTCVSFFAMWPSRGSVYIAPADAQQEIIHKWAAWLKQNSTSLHCTPLQNPQPDQWLW